MGYLIPIGIFAGLGLLAGVLLTVVSKIFAVKTDDRIAAAQEALPQVNCGQKVLLVIFVNQAERTVPKNYRKLWALKRKPPSQ